MKALFIGGTGTISTDVVALAQQKGWEITLLNRGSKKMPEGIHSIIADINDEEAVAKAIVSEHYDVVAQFIGYTAEDVKRDIRLFQNALDFSGLLVRDCMVPRVDIEAIDRTDSIRELTSRFIDTHFSRLPVYEENIDRIIGYVNTKSLFRQPATIDEILQQIDYVPESMPVQKLLTAFIKKRHSVAVVIDEFGGTAGMITIEDILEEIFGEIEDEHDDPGLVEKQMGDGEFIFSGRLEVEYINGKYHLDIPESDEYDTLAGYVIDRYQGIPSAGETILDGGRKIRVLRTESSKIELLRITLVGTSSQKSVQA